MSGGIDDRLTDAQIHGLETWLAHVDPDDPVQMTQLVIDAIQALVEEVRERRAGAGTVAFGAADIRTIQAIRGLLKAFAVGPLGARKRSCRGAAAGLRLLDRMLSSHGAKP